MPDSRQYPSWLANLLLWLALPPAWLWVRHQERRILEEGRPLDSWEARDAVEAGVTNPEHIRLRVVPVVPTPGGAWLRGLARLAHFSLDPPLGMALGNGIYLERGIAGERATFIHECVHVAQYERFGGKFSFLRRYLFECLRDGYVNSALEAEANRVSRRLCDEERGRR